MPFGDVTTANMTTGISCPKGIQMCIEMFKGSLKGYSETEPVRGLAIYTEDKPRTSR